MFRDRMLLWFLLSAYLFKLNCAYTKLFNTEDSSDVQSYDCIYYTNITAVNNESIPYCIRTKESITLNRSSQRGGCANSGMQWAFKDLKEMNISHEEILTWSSSIEMADRYVSYLITKEKQLDDEKICNCSQGTFGKFCEYQFLTMNSFEETIDYQFHLKKICRNGSQLWSNITCYITLANCYSGLQCLVWQNICDGKQQCMDGIDEDNCEELEYNECQENEYRCKDGSCIAEQYWLDGEFDCSDMSDEQKIIEYPIESVWCPLISSSFNCDEIKPYSQYFACGDGQFITITPERKELCYNYRLKMFFCEYQWTSQDPSLWTLTNGHCVDKVIMEKTLTEMDDAEKCVFFLKCRLTRMKNVLCENATDSYRIYCIGKSIKYPQEPFFKPYVEIFYQQFTLEAAMSPTFVNFNGSVKCIGFQALAKGGTVSIEWNRFMKFYPFDNYLCLNAGQVNFDGPQFDKNCWNETKPSFSCQKTHKCISKRRVRDNINDCYENEDEVNPNGCEMKGKHEFSCTGTDFNARTICLSTFQMGDTFAKCADASDTFIAQLNWLLADHKCKIPNTPECQFLRIYIKSKSSILIISRESTLSFRQFCDTLWDLPMGFDESMCDQWKCPSEQFQCLSGHCVTLSAVIKQEITDWYCPDASDKAGLLRIVKLSTHNARLINHSQLDRLKANRLLYGGWFDAFSMFCNRTLEYPCILANVSEPLNFVVNRPCVNLTRLGDGIIDCYGGLDERNVLSCGNNTSQKRGFDFHCDYNQCIPYYKHCKTRCSNRADDLLCEQLPQLDQPSCRDPGDLACNSITDEKCHPNGMDEFYCDTMRDPAGRRWPYLFEGWKKRETYIHLSSYPQSQEAVSSDTVQLKLHEATTNDLFAFQKQSDNGRDGWVCGRGVAIKGSDDAVIKCFCPPSLFGEYCQYYSDRIAVIVSLDDIPTTILDQPSNVVTVLALLLADNVIIDHHIFHLPIIRSNSLNKKFRFNLVYRRPKLPSNSWTIQFEAYETSADFLPKFLAAWEYLVHFPFLPSYRLAEVLKFKQESTFSMQSHICQKANPCHSNGICHPIMNKIVNLSAFYCYCRNNSFGKICEHFYTRPASSANCSTNALLRPLTFSKSICLCPTYLYGPTCHLYHTCMYKNPCGVDRGKCYHNPDNLTHDYICICDKKYFGDHCEFESAMIRINFTELSFVRYPNNFIMSSIIQLCDFHNSSLELILRQKRVYSGLPTTLTEIFHNYPHLPSIGLLKLYHKCDLSNDYVANLKEPEYFLLYVISSKILKMNITSIISVENHCPNIQNIVQTNKSKIEHLSELLISNEPKFADNLNKSLLIFKYHLLCDPPYSLLCFHDDAYFCICDMYGRAECSHYDSTMDQCAGRCLAGGQCIHGDMDSRKDFICLCPHCFYGSICQHNTKLFSFTLETLVTDDLHSSSVVLQIVFFCLLIVIPTILFAIGILNNICCYVTFNRKKPLLVGTGHYLRMVAVINQLTLFSLLFKLIHIVLSIKGYIVDRTTNTLLCKILSYFLSCTSRMSYWLMGMVAIERVYVTWHLTGTWLKSPKTAKFIIIIVIIAISAFDIHEIIFYQSIEDPKSSDINNSSWCVTSYSSTVAKYNQINVMVNYIMPFLINILSSSIIAILIIRKKQATTKTEPVEFQNILVHMRVIIHSCMNVFTANKELILAPIVTMLPQLLSLPQIILSFSLACQEFQVGWQRYLLILSYLITYIPQVLSYKLYVSPSSFYRKEFSETKLHHKILTWRRNFFKE